MGSRQRQGRAKWDYYGGDNLAVNPKIWIHAPGSINFVPCKGICIFLSNYMYFREKEALFTVMIK